MLRLFINHKFKIILLIVAVNIFAGTEKSGCCTAFCLNIDNQVLIAKNLDWPIEDGFLIINKKGVSKFSLLNPGSNPLKWISKYGSITFNQFGKEFPLGGMNEQGLVVEELSYSPSVYPVNDSLPFINEQQWIQYQLDNYATVEEVLHNVSKINIAKFLVGLHYFICDRNGKSAVIEFIDGKVLIYTGKDLPFEVLSNNSYQNSLRYLGFHRGFGGTKIPKGGPDSQERFVTATQMLNDYNEQLIKPVDYAFSILDSVKQHDTQWRIVYNPVQMKIEFQIKQNKIQLIDLHLIDFSEKSSVQFFELGKICQSDNVTDFLSELSCNKNNQLLKTVLDKLVTLRELNDNEAQQLFVKFAHYYQKSELH